VNTTPEAPFRSGFAALVGRPNVGKSTLFNRLLGRRQAIVHDLPGVTRDRITGTASFDDDRTFQIIDTGGLMQDEDDPLGLSRQVFLAVEESDLLLFLVTNKNRVVSRQSIAEHLYDGPSDQAPGPEFVYSHIKNLKRKLKEKGCNEIIQTVYGLGYKLVV